MKRLDPRTVAVQLRELIAHGTVGSSYFRQCEAVRAVLEEVGRPDNALPFQTALAELYPRAAPETAMDAFRGWRSRLNQRLGAASATFRLAVSQNRRLPLADRLCWFEGEDLTAGTFNKYNKEEAWLEGPIEPRHGTPARPLTVRYFVSYSHKDLKPVDSLLSLLDERLRLCKGFKFEPWRDKEAMVPGENIPNEVGRGIDCCNIGLQMVSFAYMASEFVRVHERPRFSARDEDARSGTKRLGFPIALDRFDFESHDLEEFDGHILFLHNGKQYRGLKAKARIAFADACVKKILQAVQRYLGGPADVGGSTLSHKLSDKTMLEPAARGLPKEYVLARGRRVSLQRTYEPEPDDSSVETETSSLLVLDYLLNWANVRRTTPLFALLGEYGMGKTISCKKLTLELLERREHAASDRTPPPMPVYLDMRYARGLFRSETPQQGGRRFEHVEIDDLVNAIFRESWKARRKPDAADLRRLIAGGNVLLVFDGFDEVAVHLHPNEAQSLIRTMWSLLPPDALSPDIERRPEGADAVQMLISCRTHYFRDLAQQANLFTGHQRDLERGADFYDAMTLLPFTDEQIENFLVAYLRGEDKARRALDTIRNVHDLSELARRPVLLDLIGGHLVRIETLAAKGEKINAARLYDLLSDEWFARDDAKHTFDIEIKKALMARLAGAMWRGGERVWPARDLEVWLDSELRGDPRLKERYADLYRGNAREILYEDLRTSTFVVRPSEDVFCFAHNSIHEYFLARYLFQTLSDGDTDAWDGIRPSRECMDFLGDIACENSRSVEERRFFDELGKQLRGPYRPGVSEIAFRVALDAQRRGNAVVPRGRYQLAGAKFSGDIVRRDGDSRIDLSGSDFTGAILRHVRFSDVAARDCIFNGAALDFVSFERVDLSGGSFERVHALASVFRHCRMSDLRTSGASWRKTVFIHCRNLQGLDGKDATSSGPLVVPGHDVADRLTSFAKLRLETKWGHSGIVHTYAFSPDSTRVVSGAEDCTLHLWDGETGERLMALRGHEWVVLTCAFSPDGRRIVSGSVDETLRLWDAENGEELMILRVHTNAEERMILGDLANAVLTCAFSPDGRRIVSGSYDRTLRLWDAENGEELMILRGHTDSVVTCAFSPDGRRIVSGSYENTLRLWDAENGEEIAVLQGRTGSVSAYVFSPDGRRIVSGSEDRTLRLWDAENGEELMILRGHTDSVTACAFSPDGRRIVSGSVDATLRLWDAENGEEIAVLQGRTGSVLACAFSPNGNRIASQCEDSTYGNQTLLRLWDGDNGEPVAVSLDENEACTLAFSPDGTRIVTGIYDRAPCLWDGNTGEKIAVLEGHTEWVYGEFSPNGRRIVTWGMGCALHLWDTKTGEEIAVLPGHTDAVRDVVFVSDGARIVSGADDGTMRVWDSKTGQEVAVLQSHRRLGRMYAFSPDGARIVSDAARDNDYLVWDSKTGEQVAVLERHDFTMEECAFSPDGARIVANGNYEARVWDSETGKEDAVRSPDEHTVLSCAFSPDGTHIVSGTEDATVLVWDSETGEEVAVLRGHPLAVHTCAFSPDGRRIVSGSADGTVLVWDSETGEEVVVLQGHTGAISYCAFSPDGACIVSGAADHTLRLWDGETGEPIAVCHHLPNGGHLTYSAREERVLGASGDAWSYFHWFAPGLNLHPSLPLEADPRIGVIPKDGYRADTD